MSMFKRLALATVGRTPPGVRSWVYRHPRVWNFLARMIGRLVPAGERMSPHITITAAHWVYLAGVMAVVLTMILRANVVVPSIVATFAVALVWTHSPVGALGSIFNASFVAAKELFNIFLPG